MGALLLVAALYFGINIGEVYLRYYRFKDAMSQSARFGTEMDDQEMLRRLGRAADSIGVPPARNITVTRDSKGIHVSAHYAELVELPLFVREFEFNPVVSAPR